MSTALRSVALVSILLLAASASALHLAPAAPATAGEHSLDAQAKAALRACPDAACNARVARSVSDRAATDLAALPTGRAGVAAVSAYALSAAGFSAADVGVPRSASLSTAILHFYDVIGQPVDASLRADVLRQTSAMDPAWQAALTPLVDALSVSAIESRGILSPADHALLLSDPARTSLLLTLAPESAAAKEQRAAMARVDHRAIARAAMPLALAVSRFDAPAATTGCERQLDLPFIVVGGACADTYTDTYALQIDAGGDDVYLNNAGGAAAIPSLAIDQGDGNDIYRSVSVAQGAALASVGILEDEGGSDLYNASTFSQGSGNFGFGLLYDAGAGDDVYESPSGPIVSNLDSSAGSIGTKASAVGGVGILVDEGGSDHMQQDGLDGFVYGGAEGFGLMLQRGDGDDTYVSNEVPVTLLGSYYGLFAGPVEISAEADGTAILYEEGGNDLYVMGPHVRQGGQGTAGVGALTLLLERGGNDAYVLGPSIIEPQFGLFPLSAGQGSAYAVAVPPGPALAVLHDAAGDDTYTAVQYAQGYGVGGVGALLDDGGADTYSTAAPILGARADGGAWLDGQGGVGIDST